MREKDSNALRAGRREGVRASERGKPSEGVKGTSAGRGRWRDRRPWREEGARGTETKTTGGEVSSRAKVGDAVLAADFEQELAVDLSVQRHVLDETCQMPSLC